MRGVGTQHDTALLEFTLRFKVFANHQNASELAVRARSGLQGHGVHSGDGGQTRGQGVQQLERALGGLRGLIGVDVCEPRRNRFVNFRVVLHGAASQRVKVGVH